MPPALIDVNAAAAYLGTTKAHLYSMVHERRIPHVKLGDSRYAPLRFKIADLDAWVDAHRVDVAS